MKKTELSRREIEVLSLIRTGATSKEVAEALFISFRTVDFHLVNIFNKLKVHNRLTACRRAEEMGLLLPGVTVPRSAFKSKYEGL